MVVAFLLAASVVFGAADQYIGSLPTLSWGVSASLLSAPWLLVAFVGGWTQRGARRGVLLGIGCTYATLLGYGLMTLSPIEGAHLTWTSAIGFSRGEAAVLVGGLITGPLFGWFGHRWLVARAWTGALVLAAAFCLEPLADGAVRPRVITSALVQQVEIAAGIVMVGYVVLVVASGRQRTLS